MAFPTLLGGTTVTYGGQPTIAGYIVENWNSGGADIKQEPVMDAAGKEVSRIILQVCNKITGTLIALTGTFSEFAEGALCTVTAYTTYFVDSCSVAKVAGATRGTVSMTQIFQTA